MPKLFFGNNFQELRYKDFAPVTQKLVTTLESMGVITTPSAIADAPVSAIHYSKNIPLTDGSTPYHYINKIKQANVKLSLDTNQTDYRNDGHSYKWHCNAYEVIFYDKIRDLEKAKASSKRALEKDSALQLNLFDNFLKRLEIFRMEVRLNKRKKIKQLFGKLGVKSDLTFKKLFKPAISKKVLLHYLNELESKRPPLLDCPMQSDKSLLATLRLNNPELNSRNILQAFGLRKVLESMTLRELRTMLGARHKKTWPARRSSKSVDWYRLMANTRAVKIPGARSPFKIIREHVVKFKPLKLEEF